jgi:hypothetical protein
VWVHTSAPHARGRPQRSYAAYASGGKYRQAGPRAECDEPRCLQTQKSRRWEDYYMRTFAPASTGGRSAAAVTSCITRPTTTYTQVRGGTHGVWRGARGVERCGRPAGTHWLCTCGSTLFGCVWKVASARASTAEVRVHAQARPPSPHVCVREVDTRASSQQAPRVGPHSTLHTSQSTLHTVHTSHLDRNRGARLHALNQHVAAHARTGLWV